jgi:hypothetical protein
MKFKYVKGFHFCQAPTNIINYCYEDDCKSAEIYAEGKILEESRKCVCSKMSIIKELILE